ncbi:Uncharacterised protein [BD1-7 clade bacterium]|uniref:HTH luxR-type domain-containing protein n=1 Tax=BD1-7 clade bacterium TaxID=2029982 RepID=A0A5S9Q1T0_9GAMM|nr:Uncharacterised protein [BD1-7 clade bacterium]CAA0111913.1 Uncharacterised protein [BD1-7 clade bacterium]
MLKSSDKLVELIYRSAVDEGVFLDLCEGLAALSDANISDDEKSQHEVSLLGHFNHSAMIAERVSQLTSDKLIAEKILDQVSTAIFVLDAKARVLFHNLPATRVLETDSRISIADEKISLTEPEQQVALLSALQSWDGPASSEDEAMLLGRSDANAQIMVLSPAEDAHRFLHEQLPGTATGVLFIAGHASSNRQQQQRLQQLYQLTPSEADITLRLAQGLSVEEIAEARSSKPATIRGYIKSIFQKTKTRRQAELVALILRAPLHVALTGKNAAIDGQDVVIAARHDRQVMLRSYGPENGLPVIWCHASLSCRFERPRNIDFLFKNKLRLLVLDRAGYGETSGPPYDSLNAFVDDVQDVVNHFQLSSFRLVGMLAGAGYALACAAHLADKVDEVLLLDPFAPGIEEHKIPGAPLYYRTVPRVARRFPTLVKKVMQIAAHEFSTDWRSAYNHVLRLFNEQDRRVLDQGAVKNQAITQATEAMRQGADALANDIILAHQAWPFELADIQARCWIATGNGDPVVEAFARQLYKGLERSELILRNGEGFAAMLYETTEHVFREAGWIK